MPYFTFDQAIILSVSGPDSPRYLNSRLTSDISELTVGSSCPSAALSAQGKVQGFFCVFRSEQEKFVLSANSGPRDEVIAAVKQFIVADRVEVEDLSQDFKLLHIYAEPQELLDQLVDANQSILFPNQRCAEKGHDLICPNSELEQLEAKLKVSTVAYSSLEQAELLRIKARIPSFPLEMNSQTLFSESGFLSAISFNKGCYVGQEVIEKIDAVGKSPKRLCHVFFDGVLDMALGDVISDGGQTQMGSVVSFAKDLDEEKTYAFVRCANKGLVEEGSECFWGEVSGWIRPVVVGG